MILFRTIRHIPKVTRTSFRVFQIAISLCALGWIVFLAYTHIFPSHEYSYAYDGKEVTENALEEPLGLFGGSFEGGLVSESEQLRTYAGTSENLSSLSVQITLERQESMPEMLTLRIRKSYRSFFYPEGDGVTATPEERVLAIEGKPYLLTSEAMRPLVSERAALSWTTAEEVLQSKPDTFDVFPLDEAPAGFRPGTLVTDEREIYLIDAESRRRPIETLTIFEALGFSSGDVIPVAESDLATHPPGPALTLSSHQSDGIFFRDARTGELSVIESGTIRPIESEKYAGIAETLATPITATHDSLDQSITCDLHRHPTFRNRYRCDVSTDSLANLPGRSYEFSLIPESNITIKRIDATTATRPSRENFSIFYDEARETFFDTYRR